MVPGPVFTGTFVYILLGLAFGVLGVYFRRNGRFSRDDSQIYCTSVIVGTFCIWIMWLCTWMHQWNPIIVPTVSSAAGSH